MMKKSSLIRKKFREAGQGWYTFRTIQDDEGNPLRSRIVRVDLLELAILKSIPFEDVAPADLAALSAKKGGKAAQAARQRALEKMEKKVQDTAIEFLTSDEQKGVQLGIQIIDAGCPDLTGAIKLREEDCEWEVDENGEPVERLDLIWKDLGEDFPDLIQAILKLSGIWEERARKARTFR